MSDDKEKPSLGSAVERLSHGMLGLGPGPLARLRRMDADGPGEGEFWRLAIECGLKTDSLGMRFVKLMAILTPKGAPRPDRRLHDRKRPFGAALAEAGYPETRLMRFLALPFEKRGEALERMARWLLAKDNRPGGVDCVDIACLLFSADPTHTRRLAESFYRHLPMQQHDQEKETAA